MFSFVHNSIQVSLVLLYGQKQSCWPREPSAHRLHYWKQNMRVCPTVQCPKACRTCAFILSQISRDLERYIIKNNLVSYY